MNTTITNISQEAVLLIDQNRSVWDAHAHFMRMYIRLRPRPKAEAEIVRGPSNEQPSWLVGSKEIADALLIPSSHCWLKLNLRCHLAHRENPKWQSPAVAAGPVNRCEDGRGFNGT